MDDVPKECSSANTSEVYSFACPSHGWEVIQDELYNILHTLDPAYEVLARGVPIPNWVGVTGHGSQRRLTIGAGTGNLNSNAAGYDPAPSGATIQQSAVADALTEAGELWFSVSGNMSKSGHGNVLKQQDVVHSIKHGYCQPYTAASCDIDIINGTHDRSEVAFPLPPRVHPDLMLNKTKYNDKILHMLSFVYPAISKDQILSIPGSPAEYRLKWVELPQDPFNGSAIGAVILFPQSATTSTQNFLVCTLGAGWGSSMMNTSLVAGGTTTTTSLVTNPDRYTGTSSTNKSEDYYEQPKAGQLALGQILDFGLPIFPEKQIAVTEAWAKYLNPSVPILNTTVINALLSTYNPVEQPQGIQLQIRTAGGALAALLANGLASMGANGRLQGNMKTLKQSDGSDKIDANYWFSGKGDMFIVDPEKSKDWVKFHVETSIEGYAYNVRGAPSKVAISFLLAYCIIALTHTLYAAITGERRLIRSSKS